jgi:hypothetical protein
MGKISLSGEPITNGVSDDELLMGFDRMTDNEIMYMMDRSPYPEYMGSKVSEWLQRRKTRAKTFVKKVSEKYKKMPTWAKVLTAPLAAAALPVAAVAAPIAIAKKRKERLAKMTPEQRAAEQKKRRKRLGIAAALVPGIGLAAFGAVKGVQAIQKRRKARIAKRTAARTKAAQKSVVKSNVNRIPVSSVISSPAKMSAVAIPKATNVSEQLSTTDSPVQKKSGLGGLLGLGALAALPFLLG